MALVYKRQSTADAHLKVYVDSDHAGDLLTRRSTSGLCIMRGTHLLRHSSTLQVPIGLNSGESEYDALVHGAAYSLGTQAMHEYWGLSLTLTILSDRSSDRSFSKRRGLGKQRHVQTRFLWLQDRVKLQHLTVHVVKGTENPADVLTKALTRNDIMKSMRWLGLEDRSGCANSHH